MAFSGRTKRKKRTDRNHVIYEVLNKSTGQSYIGLTYVRPKTKTVSQSKMPLKSAQDRFTSHCYRAERGSETLFHENIRRYGTENFHVRVVEVIRGKAEAHQREIELMRERKPELNMSSMGRYSNQ